MQASGSLASSFLGKDLRLGENVSYHLGSEVKDLLKGVLGNEALRTANELSLRLSMLTAKFPVVDQA